MSENSDLSGGVKVMKKLYIDPASIAKMKRLISLFSEELGDNPKEMDVISFFVSKSFEMFLKSGEIQERINKIVEG